jgi:hypothetical protein
MIQHYAMAPRKRSLATPKADGIQFRGMILGISLSKTEKPLMPSSARICSDPKITANRLWPKI